MGIVPPVAEIMGSRVDVKDGAVRIAEADLLDARDREAIVALVREYAVEPMGGGRDLTEGVRGRLVDGLRRHPTSHVLLAWHEDAAVGIAVCFLGYSTFAARPLLNLHDLAVTKAWRGRGVGRALLEAVERKARDLGCCKLTLEVRDDNDSAKALYRSVGFDAGPGRDLFWQKPL